MNNETKVVFTFNNTLAIVKMFYCSIVQLSNEAMTEETEFNNLI